MENKTSYLYFRLGNEYFAISVDNVTEVIAESEPFKIPKTPDFLLGITTYRGKIIPVVDLAIKFGIDKTLQPAGEIIFKRSIIVVRYRHKNKDSLVGLLVDKIYTVLYIEKLNINDFPEIGSKYNLEFIYGLLYHNNNYVVILDVDKILSSAEKDILLKSNNLKEQLQFKKEKS